jgi:uncharacterized membrane protein YkvA (DUF1232 family)
VTLLKLLLTSRRKLARAFVLFRDTRVSVRLKILAVIGVLFILSPLNVLGDIPILGIVDDAVLITLLLAWFVRKAEPALAAEPNGGIALAT